MTAPAATDVPGASVVVGANGGIGSALAQQLAARGETVIALSRTDCAQYPHSLRLDLRQDDSIDQACEAIRQQLAQQQGSLRAIYICSGILHAPALRPERRIEDLDSSAFETVMRINALGPLRLLAGLKPLLPRACTTRIAAISARVGSISDNRLGGWYSYRCSKAALNMGLQTLAVELRRSHPECSVTLFHPGTTDTALSKPFQQNVPAGKLFTAERAARQFLTVLDQRGGQAGAAFLDWAGKPISF